MGIGLALVLGCQTRAPATPPKDAGEIIQESGVIKANAALGQAAPTSTPTPSAQETLTTEGYEALLLGLAHCEVGVFGVDNKCQAWKAFERLRRRSRALMKTAADDLAALGRKHIKHEAPAVRLQSAALIDSLFKDKNDEALKLIIEAAKAEQHPMVLKRFVRLLSSAVAKNDEARALIIRLADHDNEKVRMEVAKALTDAWARDTEGTLERAIQLVELDKSEAVRIFTCKYLGARADDRALPTLEQRLTPKTSPNLYAACLRGLISMWSSPVPHAKPSKAAYQLTLKVLGARPQPKEVWTVLSGLEWAARPEFKARAPWYQEAALIKLLKGFVLDKGFFWLGRSQAADVLAKISADRALLEALKVKIEANAEGDDNQLVRKLNEIIAKMKAQPAPAQPASTPR